MTNRTLREKIASLPRYKKVRGGMDYEDMMMVRPDGGWLSRAEVLRILDAHTAAQPAPDAVAEEAWTGPGEEPHEYWPDLMAMGDCAICGHVYAAHFPAKGPSA